MVLNFFNRPLETLESRYRRVLNLRSHKVGRVENFNPYHNRNVFNLSKDGIKCFVVLVFRFPKIINHQRNVIIEFFLYEDSSRKGVSDFQILLPGNQSETKSMI